MKNQNRPSKSIVNLIILLFCIVAVCTVSIPFLSYATTQDQLDDTYSELESLKDEQGRLSGDLSDLTSQLDSAAAQLTEIDNQILAKQDEIDLLQIELERLEQEKQAQYGTMKLRIQYMYEHSTENTLELLLQSKSLSELLTRTEYIRQISEYDRRMLAQLEEIFTQEEQTHQILLSDLENLQGLKVQAADTEKNIKQLIADKRKTFDLNSENIAKAEQLALDYERQIEADRIAREEAERNQQKNNNSGEINQTPIDYDASDLSMLAAIIECEAGNQSYEGMLAVGSVVVNRVNSSRFPSSVSGVILASGQFSPVASGRFAIVLARGARETCIQAAQDVLSGKIVTGALYFHVYRPGVDIGGTIIGDHVFF